MKLWYQSMSRQKEWGSYNKVLRQILNEVKDKGTEIEVHGITKIGGLADQYRYLEYLETGEVMENVQIAMKRGFDAFLIGNIGDPGIRECREIANIPVLGLCETSLHIACMMGANFSFVGISPKWTPRVLENVYRYGVERRMVTTEPMSTSPLDLKRCFIDPEYLKVILQQFFHSIPALSEFIIIIAIPASTFLYNT